MKQVSAILFALALPLLSRAQYNSENLKLAASDASESPAIVNRDYSFGKLKLYPVYATVTFQEAHRDLGKFTPLGEAQNKNLVKITEHVAGGNAPANNADAINNNDVIVREQNEEYRELNSGAQVNKLFIENLSKDTVYIMAGEVVKGGKQNRVIAQDMVLPPASGQIDLSVFCVEHGRWNNSTGDGSEEFKTSGYQAPAHVRKAVEVEKNQSAVWSKVSETNVKNGTSTSTDALTANEDNEKFQNELRPYLDNATLKNLPADAPNIVGVVAVTGDRVIACDIFATHQLFESQYLPLLNSYASEAVTNGAPVSLTVEKVNEYIDGFLKNEDKQVETLEGKGKIYNFEIEEGKTVKTRLSIY